LGQRLVSEDLCTARQQTGCRINSGQDYAASASTTFDLYQSPWLGRLPNMTAQRESRAATLFRAQLRQDSRITATDSHRKLRLVPALLHDYFSDTLRQHQLAR